MLMKHFDTIQKSLFVAVIDWEGHYIIQSITFYEQVSCRIGKSRITGCYRI